MKWLGKIWAWWAIFVFVIQEFVMMFFVVPALLLNNSPVTERNLLRLFFTSNANALLFFFGIRNKVKGFDRLDPKQNYIVVSNHTTAIDILANASAMKGRPFKFLAKAELLKVPFLGINVGRLCIPVDRSNAEGRKKSYEDMAACLAQKMDVLIYPEGTRNRTDKPLKDFYNGAFKLSVETQTPIAICVTKRAKRLNDPKYGLWLKPGKMESIWLEALFPNDHSIEELKDKAISAMKLELSKP